MAEFYHIYLSVRADVTPEQIEKKMNMGLDWYHFDSNVWIVYTTVNAATWFTRLKPLVKPGGHVLICKLDITERSGWMPKTFWEWLNQER